MIEHVNPCVLCVCVYDWFEVNSLWNVCLFLWQPRNSTTPPERGREKNSQQSSFFIYRCSNLLCSAVKKPQASLVSLDWVLSFFTLFHLGPKAFWWSTVLPRCVPHCHCSCPPPCHWSRCVSLVSVPTHCFLCGRQSTRRLTAGAGLLIHRTRGNSFVDLRFLSSYRQGSAIFFRIFL